MLAGRFKVGVVNGRRLLTRVEEPDELVAGGKAGGGTEGLKFRREDGGVDAAVERLGLEFPSSHTSGGRRILMGVYNTSQQRFS